MRATDRWAIEERGRPVAGADGARGDGPRRARAARSRRRGRSRSSAARATTAATGSSPRGCCARRAATSACCSPVAPTELQGDAAANLRARCRATAEPFAPERLDGAARDRRRAARHGLRRRSRASRPRPRSRRSTPRTRRSSPPTCPAASTPRPARSAARRCTRRATATFAAAKPGPVDRARARSTRARCASSTSASPRARPASPAPGSIGERVLALIPRRDARGDEVQLAATSSSRAARAGSPARRASPRAAAMRAGAGYVTALVPASLQPIFAIKLLEVMTRALPDDDGAHTRRTAPTRSSRRPRARRRARRSARGSAASDEAQEFAREVARRAPVPLVLDADGLNAHAGRAGASCAARDAPTVLTPHAGELGRLLGSSATRSRRSRLRHAREAARARAARSSCSRATTRSSRAPDGRAVVNPRRAPALATAGTGDVLGGVIGALLAKGMEPFAAAAAGVRLHAGAPGGRRRRGASGPRRRHRRRRGRGAARGTRGSPDDGSARSHGSTSAPSRPTRRGCGASCGGAELCAVVKADGYGHGAVPAARAALAGGATLARRGRGARGARAARRGDRGRAGPRAWARSRPASSTWRSPRARTSSPGARSFVDAVAARGWRRRVHVKLDTGMGRLGTRDPGRRCGSRRRPRRRRAWTSSAR